jgi:hypothetical protein
MDLVNENVLGWPSQSHAEHRFSARQETLPKAKLSLSVSKYLVLFRIN